MYSIITVIYGTYLPDEPDLQKKIFDLLDKHTGEDWGEEHTESDIWTQMYHGASMGQCAYIGVALDTIDVTSGGVALDSLAIHPNATEIDQATALTDQLPQSVRDILPPVGVHFFFSTS